MPLYSLISFVKRGKNRKLIFESLSKPMMPSELVKKIYSSNSNTHFNLVSRALAELKEKGLVKILNPEDKTGRFYKKTQLGEEVGLEMEKEE